MEMKPTIFDAKIAARRFTKQAEFEMWRDHVESIAHELEHNAALRRKKRWKGAR